MKKKINRYKPASIYKRLEARPRKNIYFSETFPLSPMTGRHCNRKIVFSYYELYKLVSLPSLLDSNATKPARQVLVTSLILDAHLKKIGTIYQLQLQFIYLFNFHSYCILYYISLLL